jgi:hypothetical protein
VAAADERQRVAAAGVAAAAAEARSHGLRVDDPLVLHDLFSLRVHLRPAPVVARVPTWATRLVPSRVDRLGEEVAPPATWSPAARRSSRRATNCRRAPTSATASR